MAVLPEANLGSLIGQIGRNRALVENGTRFKFFLGPNGFPSLQLPRIKQPSPRRLSDSPEDIFTTPFRPTPIPFQPLPGTILPEPSPFVGGGGGGLPGLGATACNLLRGTARDFCLAAVGLLPGGGPEAPLGPTGCPGTQVRIAGKCVDFSAFPPGGDPFTTPAGGLATVGAFGLPALSPQGISRVVRKCGRGMVLGIDNLCYPKAVLTGRSKFRKWRRPVRPPISRRDVVAIKRAAGARDRVKELAKDVGLTVGAKRRAPKRHSETHN